MAKLPERQTNDNEPIVAEESKTATILLVITSSITRLLDQYSSLQTIIRIIAYCLRLSKHQVPAKMKSSIITADEMAHALSALIYCVQKMVYADDIDRIKKGIICSKELRQLDPFIDNNDIVRVGGRLTNANIPYAHKHPILLPSSHRLTTLIIDYHHLRLKHPGAHALQTQLQREYWIQSARRVIRSRLRLCMACFRTRPSTLQPKMAPLPKYRVQQLKPFLISGVDYAGPITLRGLRGKRLTPISSYICLFVCLTTKALHLELSSDLSTEAFLMALTRFSARRGPIKEIHSDCGTNFVGAARLLNPVQELTQSQSFQTKIQRHCASVQIKWCFNPPSSPHFGGLWEANVKSTKALILRSIGTHKLTAEEFTTLLTQIEATLNSRPLCPLSNDPFNYEALTPGHFLTLEPSTSLPDPSLKSVSLSKLKRWRLIADLHSHFWSRWKIEYLSTLQLRSKWCKNSRELEVGELVLIKEATHPLHWRLGRIRNLHPGADGIVRVATIDTATGSFTRPVVKLCPLPIS